jgi:hypothetical protein
LDEERGRNLIDGDFQIRIALPEEEERSARML